MEEAIFYEAIGEAAKNGEGQDSGVSLGKKFEEWQLLRSILLGALDPEVGSGVNFA